MQPLSLTLKGFRGIRDGLGLDALTLDFEALADDGALIAIAGANGRGKSTVLDNMHPYLTMPSRAVVAGAGGFAYYDHVFLPESGKQLTWALDGRSYRSDVVIRLNGRRRTEACLFELSDADTWLPVKLDDGTLSDGRVETYTRCVERLCGSADVFFTSVFAAQGKRQLSDYRNAEIKTLLADLLGQEEIAELGRKAGETVRLLKAGLVTTRHEMAALDTQGERLACERMELADAPQRVAQSLAAVTGAATALDAARQQQARLLAQREQCRDHDARRTQLHAEREASQADARTSVQALDAQERSEQQRLERLTQRIAQRSAQAAQRRERLQGVQTQCQALLAREPMVQRAARRLPLAERLLCLRSDRASQAREQTAGQAQVQASLQLLLQRIAGIEREAGQAALQEQSLLRRLNLTAQVPCSGTDLQGRCKLLCDAREAQTLIPGARIALQRLASQRQAAESEIQAVRARVETLAPATRMQTEAERRLERTRSRASRLALLASKAEEMQTARSRLAQAQPELAALNSQPGQESEDERCEREEQQAIAAALHAITGQRSRQSGQLQQTLVRLDAALAALPQPFDAQLLAQADAQLSRATAAHSAAQQAQLAAVRQEEALAGLHRQQAALGARRCEAAGRAACTENALGDWTLFARCMGKDGLIALVIDDAGPALSGLTNQLLQACYGPRFSVSIVTQTDTAKGDKREDFDILVHDAQSGESKSVRLMSGGERVSINECLVRAVALYLAQTSQRSYGTLFSDEADGPLDPERKRMFGAMKRQVLRLGGYRREYFISQTAELAAMADAVIDLEAYAQGQRAGEIMAA